MSDDRLRVEGFGPLRAYVDGAEIDLGPPKQSAAFAVLALCGDTTVSRAELIDRIWGEAPPATAGGSVHTYLSGLRRALGPAQHLLISSRSGYALRLEPPAFDLLHAEALADRVRDAPDPAAARRAVSAALAAWPPGAVLVGVPGPFVAQARDRFAKRRLQLLIEHAEVAPPGDLPRVIAELLTEVPAHRFDERLRTVLMRTLHRAGRTAEALAQYEDLRRGLAAELGISPSAATQAGFSAILADDRREAEATDAGAAPPDGAPVRPAELPTDNDAFVGRAAELLAVVDASSGRAEPRRRIVMIVGVGGIGKTALAIRCGHMLRDGYPDGQIYINLRGFDPSHAALTPAEALHQLLTSIGARHIPTGHQERAALWRSLLADQRLLLLLDNARSADQVEDLLPGGSTSFVIVTSRNRLSGLAVRHGARRVSLGPLSQDEALDLLAATVGPTRVRAEPDSAHRLAVLCDRSPFALQIAAERVVSTSTARIGDLAKKLESVQHRLDALQLTDDPLCSVRGVLSWSYTALPEAPARAFRLLGVFPGASVTAYPAAALFGVPADRAEDLLGTLSALSLLEQQGERFTMHDLTRLYAAETARELDPDDQREAFARVLSWYRVTLSAGDDDALTRRGVPAEPTIGDVAPLRFDRQRDRLRWCGHEWQNIVALVHAANRRGQHGFAWRLTYLMFEYFYAAGRPLEWLDLIRVALRSAELIGNRHARAVLLNHSSVAYSRLGRNETAVRLLRDGLDLLDQPDDWQHRISLLGNLASTLREAGEYEGARSYAYQTRDLAEKEGIDYYVAAAHDVLCELDAETGRWEEAMREGLAGLVYARRSHSQLLAANLLINTGLARHGLGDQAGAEETFAEALKLSTDIGDIYHEALALFGLARASVGADGRSAECLDLARRALTRFEELHAEEAFVVRAFLADRGAPADSAT